MPWARLLRILALFLALASAVPLLAQPKRCLRPVTALLAREISEPEPPLQVGDAVRLRARGVPGREHVFLGRIWSHQYHTWRLLFLDESARTLRVFHHKQVTLEDPDGVRASALGSQTSAGSVRTGRRRCMASSTMACLDYLWAGGHTAPLVLRSHGQRRQKAIDEVKRVLYPRNYNIDDQNRDGYRYLKSQGIRVRRIQENDPAVLRKLKAHLRSGGIGLVNFYDEYYDANLVKIDYFGTGSSRERVIPLSIVPDVRKGQSSIHQVAILGLVRMPDGSEAALVADSFPKKGIGSLFLWPAEELAKLPKSHTGTLLITP